VVSQLEACPFLFLALHKISSFLFVFCFLFYVGWQAGQGQGKGRARTGQAGHVGQRNKRWRKVEMEGDGEKRGRREEDRRWTIILQYFQRVKYHWPLD
jgi:hypothetical protein